MGLEVSQFDPNNLVLVLVSMLPVRAILIGPSASLTLLAVLGYWSILPVVLPSPFFSLV